MRTYSATKLSIPAKLAAVFTALAVNAAPAAECVFDWTPNGTPSGSWIPAWKNEANNVTRSMTGPDGTTTNLYAVTEAGASSPWSPYYSDAAAMSAFTLSVYGTVDAVAAGTAGPAVLWCMGKHSTATGDSIMLVKDSRSHILLVHLPAGQSAHSRAIDAGLAPSGFHLYTVRFSASGGASVQIDDGDPAEDAGFTSLPGDGFQVGTILGGIGSASFSRGAGFAVLRMVAFDTDELSESDFYSALGEYLPGTCSCSSTYAAGAWSLPADATATPGGYARGLAVKSGAVEQSLGDIYTNAVSASVLASIPENAAGTIASIAVATSSSRHIVYAYANGDGTFTIYYDNKAKTSNSVSSSAIDATGIHLWTLAFNATGGAKLYLDGDEIAIASDTGIKWTGENNLHLVSERVSFGADCNGENALSGMAIYAVDTDFAADSSIFDAASLVSAASRIFEPFDFLENVAGEPFATKLSAFYNYNETGYATVEIAEECVLRISEIMPKPTDALVLSGMEGMDVNGLESGWVEVENTSSKWADLADYRFIRVNRGKKTDPAGSGNFPSRLVPPHSRAVFYTSERYPNSADEAVSAFENGTFDGAPAIFPEYGDILVWGDKVNPKKHPYVRLYYAPGGKIDSVVDTVVVPSDLPEGWSIIVGHAAEGEGTRRWMCPTPTRGTANTSTASLARIGPNVGPLYEKKGQKKTGLTSEFDLPSPPATPGTDYGITLPVNAVMNPDGSFSPRAADGITSMKLVYRKNLDDSTLVTNAIDMASKTTDENWGDCYTASIPASYFPAAGHLIQWKVLITDGEGVEWTSPSFNNKDDGYEWFGTIVEPSAEQMSGSLPTWHMFASGASLSQMDVDADNQTLENNARVAIYDSSTSTYYDYVRIDLRGNTSRNFTKKSHGLRFAKAHPLTMRDIVSGEDIEGIRKTSLIAEYADPSYMRQMIAFWLFRKMGNNAPFDFPVRCNLNGEFYQLAFNSERFTDELIEDVYGLDKYGYGYKSVGTLKSGSSSTAGGIEKKTPDDEDESNITVLQQRLRSQITAAQNVAGDTTASKSSTATDATGLENAALSKFVVQNFNLPAWLNYMASAKITQEMDDVWANLCIYLDDPEMKEGVRGQGTWMPLGYDFNLSFGQWYFNDVKGGSTKERFGLMSNHDWFKSHPFYGGNRVRCWKGTGMGSIVGNGNDAFEAIWQSAKFRRLYLRRLRTLMDEELKEPGTSESETPFMAKMREMAELMRADSVLDAARWPNDNTDDAIQVWTDSARPSTIDEGIDDIWNNYVVPRRTHLYVTHSVTNTAKTVGYGSNLNAGIPEKQSPVATLAPGISLDVSRLAEGVAAIYNGNSETIDMSGWRLAQGVVFTFPAGTVCDANDYLYIVADRRAYVSANEASITDQVIVGNAVFDSSTTSLSLFSADGTAIAKYSEPSDVSNYLRFFAWDGVPVEDDDYGTGEWITLTNTSASATLDLTGVNVKVGKDTVSPKCNITLEGGTLAPGASITLSSADFGIAKGWEKITNGGIYLQLADANGTIGQTGGQVTQKNFSGYVNGRVYLQLTTFGDSFAHSDVVAVPYPSTPVYPGTDVALEASTAEEALAALSGCEIALTPEQSAAGLVADVLVLSVVETSGGYAATVDIKPEFRPVEDDTADPPVETGTDSEGTSVSIAVKNPVPGLWYGVAVADGPSGPFTDDLASFKLLTGSSGSKVTASKRAASSGFFKLKAYPANPAQ